MATSKSSGRGANSPIISVTKNLKGMHFPAGKQDLVSHVQQEHAGQDVVSKFQQLEDREYKNVADVMKGYGKEHRQGKK